MLPCLRKVVTIVEEAAPEVPAAAATNVDDGYEHSYALADPPSPAMEVFVDAENASMEGNTSSLCLCTLNPRKLNFWQT